MSITVEIKMANMERKPTTCDKSSIPCGGYHGRNMLGYMSSRIAESQKFKTVTQSVSQL